MQSPTRRPVENNVPTPTFYNTLREDGEIRDELRSKRYIIAKAYAGSSAQKYTGFDHFGDIHAYMKTIAPRGRLFHERYEGNQTCRFVFDIDAEGMTSPYASFPSVVGITISVEIRKYFDLENFPKMTVYDSSTKKKLSYHIISNDIAISKIEGMPRDFLDALENVFLRDYKQFEHLRGKFVDRSIYGNHTIRMVGSHKSGKANTKRLRRKSGNNVEFKDLTPDEFRRSLVTNVKGCQIIIPPERVIVSRIPTSPAEDVDEDEARRIVMMLGVDRYTNRDDWIRVGMALKPMGLEELWHDFSSQWDGYDSVDADVAWKSFQTRPATGNQKQITFGTIIQMCMKDNPGAAIVRKDRTTTQVLSQVARYASPLAPMNIPVGFAVDTRDEKYSWAFPKGDVICKSPMGTGKTYQIEEVVKSLPKEATVLYLSNRILFAREIKTRFAKYGFELYLDCPKGGIAKPRIICQVESLWRIRHPKAFDLVIVDEIESCWCQVTSPTNSNFEAVGRKLSSILSSAKRVVACDAFISDRSTHSLEIAGRTKCTVMINTRTPDPKHCIEIQMSTPRGVKSRVTQPTALIDHALKALLDGKKIIFVSASKKWLDYFTTIASEENGICGKSYTSTSTDELHQDGFNANTTWGNPKYRYIAYTSAITTGVNFDQLGVFDRLYCYFSNTCRVRDIMQATSRCRHFAESTMYYSIMKRCPQAISLCPTVKSIEDEWNVSMEMTKSIVSITTNNFLKSIATFNMMEQKIQCFSVGYEKLIEDHLRFAGYTEEPSTENPAADMSEADLTPVECYSESFDIFINLDDTRVLNLIQKRDRGKTTLAEVDAIVMYNFSERYLGKYKSAPDLKARLEKAYRKLTENPKFKKVFGTFISLEGGIDEIITPEFGEELCEVDLTNPKLKTLAQRVVFNDILERMKLCYDPMMAEEVTLAQISTMDAKELKFRAETLFGMRDRVTVKGKKVDVASAEKDSQIRYINHILRDYTGSMLVKGKQTRKMVNGVRKTVTSFNLEHDQLIVELLKIRRGR